MSIATVTILTLNVGLSLLCWWGALRLWQWRRQLSQWADLLERLEPKAYQILNEAPQNINQSLADLRALQRQVTETYQRLQIIINRLRQVQQFLTLIRLVLLRIR